MRPSGLGSRLLRGAWPLHRAAAILLLLAAFPLLLAAFRLRFAAILLRFAAFLLLLAAFRLRFAAFRLRFAAFLLRFATFLLRFAAILRVGECRRRQRDGRDEQHDGCKDCLPVHSFLLIDFRFMIESLNFARADTFPISHAAAMRHRDGAKDEGWQREHLRYGSKSMLKAGITCTRGAYVLRSAT
jgi:hypothetical protein